MDKPRWSTEGASQLRGDDASLDLIGAAGDLVELGLRPEALHVVLDHAAVPAQDLHAPRGAARARPDTIRWDLGGVRTLASGASKWIALALRPGHYLAQSFIEDPATHRPQGLEGMLADFTVG